MKRFYLLFVAFFVTTILAPPSLATAQCIIKKTANIGAIGNCEECVEYWISIAIRAEGAPADDAAEYIGLLHDAVGAWHDCFNDGADGPKLEYSTDINDYTSARIRITVTDRSTENPERCGSSSPADGTAGSGLIHIYLYTNGGSPPGVCDWRSTMLHEFGHAFGLRDVAESCDNLMQERNGTTQHIPVDECAAVAWQWKSPSEDSESEQPSDEPEEPSSPLVLDMDDNGIRTSSVEFDPVIFDLNNDGILEHAGWLRNGTEDAFLWIDLNGDGVPNNGGELFGDSSVLPGGESASNGIDALAVYDSNGDGRIDAEDAVWLRLMLWNDRNHSAAVEDGEVSRISASPVVGISLDAQRRIWEDENGNLHSHATEYWTFSGGAFERHLMEDIWFAVRPISNDRRR